MPYGRGLPSSRYRFGNGPTDPKPGTPEYYEWLARGKPTNFVPYTPKQEPTPARPEVKAAITYALHEARLPDEGWIGPSVPRILTGDVWERVLYYIEFYLKGQGIIKPWH